MPITAQVAAMVPAPVQAISRARLILSGAPVGPHHRNDRRAEAESQGDQDVFKTGSERVADRGLLAELTCNAGEQDHGEIGDHQH